MSGGILFDVWTAKVLAFLAPPAVVRFGRFAEKERTAVMNRPMVATTLAGIFLAGCVMETEVSLFASDILRAKDPSVAVDTTVILSIATGSKDNCQKYQAAIATALTTGFSSVRFVGCREGAGFASFADYRISIPIQDANKPVTGAVAVSVVWADEGAVVALVPNADRISEIRKALPNEISNDFLPEPTIAITTVVQNDLDEPVTISMQGAFIDGEPFQLPHEVTLQRRDETVIRLSDVGNAAMKNGGSLLVTIRK